MNNYFFLTMKIKPATAYAYTEGETPISHELIPLIKAKSDAPFTLTLKKVSAGLRVSDDLSELKHIWSDYQPNNLAWPLMSERMKNVVNSHLTGKENIAWIRVMVNGKGENREYFIPRFQQKLDVLDEQKTTYVPGTLHIIKPVFSLEKIKNFCFFHKPQELFWEITLGLYVNEDLKKIMQKEKLTGIDFEKTSTA